MDENTGRTVISDIIVGILMMVLSIGCGYAYSIILVTIWKDAELLKLTSYRLMFLLGIFDVVQCFPHFVTGIFTILQTTFHPWLAKAMGVLATPCYVGYAVTMVILAFNRFVQMCSRSMDKLLFTGKVVWIWLGIGIAACLTYAVLLSSNFAAIVYNPEWYSWDYDYVNYNYSHITQRGEMYIEIYGIGLAGLFYIGVAVKLYTMRRRFMMSNHDNAEIRVLVQAFVVTVYCSVLNIFWHNYKVLLPESIWSYMGLNFMWILNSGVYPFIYYVVNTGLRKRIKGRKQKTDGVTMITKNCYERKTKADLGTSSENADKLARQLQLEARVNKTIKTSPKIVMVT